MSVVDYVGGVGYNAVDFRLANLDGAIVDPADPLSPLAGRIYGVNLTISDVNVSYSAGVLVLRSATNGNGVYRKVITPGSVTLSGRPSTGSRIDNIYAILTSVEGDVNIVVQTGTTSSAPVAPLAPLGALLLAQATVPALGGAGTSIQTSQVYSRAPGAVLPQLSTALTPTVGPGQIIHYLDQIGPDALHIFMGTNLVETPLFDAAGGLEYTVFANQNTTDNKAHPSTGFYLRQSWNKVKQSSDGSGITLFNPDTGGNSGFIQCARPGTYLIMLEMSWAYQADGNHEVGLQVRNQANTLNYIAPRNGRTSGLVDVWAMGMSGFVGLGGANSQFQVQHNSNINAAVSVWGTLTVIRVGP